MSDDTAVEPGLKDINPPENINPLSDTPMVISSQPSKKNIDLKFKIIIPLVFTFIAIAVFLLLFIKPRYFNYAILPKILKFSRATPTPTPTPTNTPTPTPTPIPPGGVEGSVIDPFDNTYKRGANVRVLGAVNHETTADQKGVYKIENIIPGDYVINAETDDSVSKQLNITVKSNEVFKQNISVSLKNPKPSVISGYIFQDYNNNGTKDDGEPGLNASVLIDKYIAENTGEQVTQLQAKSDGTYSYSLPAPQKYKITPLGYTFYQQGKQSIVVSRGYGAAINLNIPYQPTRAIAGFKIYVFNDKNENGSRDGDEEFIHYQYVKVENLSTGRSDNFVVAAEGEEQSHLDFGTYRMTLIPESESWSNYYKITKGSAEVYVSGNNPVPDVLLGAHKLY